MRYSYSKELINKYSNLFFLRIKIISLNVVRMSSKNFRFVHSFVCKWDFFCNLHPF